MSDSSNKTAIGLQENIAGLLTYSLSWVSGIIFLFIEKDNKFVRFHAMQSVIIFLPISLLSFAIGAISTMVPIIGLLGLLLLPIYAIAFILWIILMFKAFQGESFKLPKIGDIAEQQLAKLDKSM